MLFLQLTGKEQPNSVAHLFMSPGFLFEQLSTILPGFVPLSDFKMAGLCSEVDFPPFPCLTACAN
jgi:hypothetical protein